MNSRKQRWVYAGLAAALLVLFFGGLVYGAVRIPLRDVLQILLGSYDGREAWRHIVLESRLPQIVKDCNDGVSYFAIRRGRLVFSPLAKIIAKLGTVFDIKVATRFVKEQKRSPLGKSPRKKNSLELSSRKLV